MAPPRIKLNAEKVTKRFILSQCSKVFDPLSLVAPVSVKGKNLISKLWKNKKSENHWDEPVGEEDLSTWHSLSKELNK